MHAYGSRRQDVSACCIVGACRDKRRRGRKPIKARARQRAARLIREGG